MLFTRKLGIRGSVSVIGALVLPMLIGSAGLVAEYGHAVLTKTQNQRVADLAAYAGATVYNATSSTDSMNSVIDNVAALNGIPAADVTGALVTSPSGDGNQAVNVTIRTSMPILISQVVGSAATVSVGVQSFAELKANAQGCIIALNSGGSGVTLSGGTAVTASGCAVDSNNTVKVPCGTTIVTPAVNYDGAAPTVGCGGITSASGSPKILKALTADPLSGNSGVATATGRLSTVSAQTAPAVPSLPGGTGLDFEFSGAGSVTIATAGRWPALGLSGLDGYLHQRRQLHLWFGHRSGGVTVNFNTGGSASTTYNINGQLCDCGTAMNFGPGTYNITKGISTGGGSVTTFGAGTFNIGPMNSGCQGGGKYSICNTGTSLTFGGPSTFVLAAGIYAKGGESLTLGAGSTNCFDIGPSSDGNAFYAGGGSITQFADATASCSYTGAFATGASFEMVGNLNIASGGGSCLQISAAAQHDIDGYLSTAGGTILGAGVYTVHGYISLGGNGGGDVSCWGSTVGMYGSGVTFVTDGSSTPGSGTCSGEAFCVGAGYGHVTLISPTTGATADLAVIGPQSPSNTTGATFAEGASNTSISGAFYFPNGPVSFSGAAALGGGVGNCLELIGSQVTLAGGSAVASTCIASGGSTAMAVLVQ